MSQPHVGGHPPASPLPGLEAPMVDWEITEPSLSHHLYLCHRLRSPPHSPHWRRRTTTPAYPPDCPDPWNLYHSQGQPRKSEWETQWGGSKELTPAVDSGQWETGDRKEPSLPQSSPKRTRFEFPESFSMSLNASFSSTFQIYSFLFSRDVTKSKWNAIGNSTWRDGLFCDTVVPASLPGDAPQNQACFAVGQWQLWKAPPWICSPSLPSFPLSLTLAL